jgi:C4-dicarboxylate-specific signal transduction histidine kinase
VGHPSWDAAHNMMRNVGVQSPTPRLDSDAQLLDAVIEISRANEHAASIIRQSRRLLKRRSDPEVQQGAELNAVFADALSILSTEANHRQVVLLAEGHKGPLLVRADPLHLLQVGLNLATNAMDAMADTKPDARRVVFRTALLDQSTRLGWQ